MLERPSPVLAYHGLANIFPLIEGAAFDDLASDIREHGLRDPIVIFEGAILDGRNRYRAATAVGAELRFRDFDPSSDGDPLGFVMSANLHRRHLADGQRSAVAAELATLRRGRPANKPQFCGITTADAARMLNVSIRSIETARAIKASGSPEVIKAVKQGDISLHAAAGLADLPVERQAELLRTADPIVLSAAIRHHREQRTMAKKARRDQREIALGDKIASANEQLRRMGSSGQKFGVVYADPEWKFAPWSPVLGGDRAVENHYPTSTTEEIASRPVADIAADDSVLYLWGTAPMLPDALSVMASWGFAYKSHLIWDKGRAGTGYWARNEHEILLIGTRGNLPAPAPGTQPNSIIRAPVGEHSVKPEVVHEMIERLFPNLPKIELNARRARPGWTVWGAEAPDQESHNG